MNFTSMKRRRGWGVAVAISTITAILMPASHADAATAAPDTVATGQINNLIDAVRSQTGAYAGIWIDNGTKTVYVAATSASVTADTVTSEVARPASGSPTMQVKVVKATYSAARLHSIASRVTVDAGLRAVAQRDASTLSIWYPDPVTDKVVIGFTKVTPRELAAVRAEYGSTARVITQPIAQSAIKTLTATQAAALIGAKASSKSSSNVVQPSIDRLHDTAPYYGGDVILYEVDGNWDQCTSGYMFGSNAMSTAGHCGTDPSTFYQNGVKIGTTSTVQWGNGRIDMQLMTGGSYAAQIWTGAAHYPVSGSGGVAQGGRYCTDGAVTGQNCTAVVSAIDVCADDSGTTVCDLDEATSSNGSVITQSGDSGGPVYTANSTSDPYAVGTICADSNNDRTSFWGDMYEEKVIFGTSPATS